MWIGVGKGKGGTGGTTSALEIAHAAVRRRRQEGDPRAIAVLDLDPQGDATTVLEPERLSPGIKDVLARPVADDQLGDGPLSLRAVLTPTAWDGIVAAPAGRLLANREIDMVPESLRALRGARLSEELDDMVADVVVDLPRGLGNLAVAGLLAIEELFIVARASLWSAQGAEEMRYSAERIRARRNPELEIAGIIVTEFDRTRDAKRILRTMRESRTLGNLVLSPPIPRNPLVRESIESFHTPLRDFGDAGLIEIADMYQGIYDEMRARQERAGQ
ncbi:ParA family protein [Streptomyces albiaxialis]|uniref:ParA family protein n=1 Tax=Streptomyces albiaxialis TaxID=329523 RepID=A0ABN2WZN4_9ACTN